MMEFPLIFDIAFSHNVHKISGLQVCRRLFRKHKQKQIQELLLSSHYSGFSRTIYS